VAGRRRQFTDRRLRTRDVAVPALLFLLFAGVAVTWAAQIRDPATRWTAIAAVLAGAGLLVGVPALGLAILQLSDVDRRLRQLTEAGEREIAIHEQMGQGTKLLSRPWDQASFDDWALGSAELIESLTDAAERRLFEFAGTPEEKQKQQLLHEKILHIRDNLLPKVRAGYWPRDEAS
jgi:hypothetical protein